MVGAAPAVDNDCHALGPDSVSSHVLPLCHVISGRVAVSREGRGVHPGAVIDLDAARLAQTGAG